MLHYAVKQPAVTPYRRLLVLLGITSAAGLSMLLFRMGYSGRRGYGSLPWDLLLAWLPLTFALLVWRMRLRLPRPHAAMLCCALLWLLFFPNAPYLVTQFMHLHPSHAVRDSLHPLASLTPRGEVPAWFDVLMLSTFAWTGLILGFISLYLIHRVTARLGGALCGWGVVVAGAALCAFGISLGRFERWNSWDLFTRPLPLLHDVVDRALNPLAHPRTAASTVGFAAFLLLGYLTLIALMHLSASEQSCE